MKRMLIIEDDQLVGSIYRHKFQSEGFQVELAADGEAGWKAVRTMRPDVVILDLMLPKLNGVEVLKRIRATPESRELPVIVLSNAYLGNLIQDAWQAGADNCLVKANCTPKQLLEIVQKALGSPGTSPGSEFRRMRMSTRPGGPTVAGGTDGAADTHGNEGADTTNTTDTAYMRNVRREFLESGVVTLGQLRGLLQTFIKSENDTARMPNLFSLYRRVHAVSSNAAVAGLNSISRMSSAIEALIKELYEKPKSITPSTLRTLAHATDFLAVLFEQGGGVTEENETPNILVVDDDAISRRAVILALEKAQLKCVSVDDPDTALRMLGEDRFDLIFLDVEMPEMNGFDLCTRLRRLPLHHETPVVFVTSQTDFESRARSTLSGGSDLIAKPFLFIELAVKALAYVLQRRLRPPAD
jgi:DNA-binding response OmpR family regulator